MKRAALLLGLALVAATALSTTAAGTAGATTPTAPPPAYYPSGPQTNVDQSALTGWTPCWSGTYADEPALSDVLAACNGDYLLLAAGPSDSTVFDVLAAAPRADVLTPTTLNATHEANGVGWYYGASSVFNWFGAWGFVPAGDTIDRGLGGCDIVGSYQEAGPDGAQRLCWHLFPADGIPTDGTLGQGWRSGTNVDLFGTDYRRVIYQPAPDSTPPTVTCSVTPTTLWPPNHKLIDITASVTVTDDGSGPAGFRLVSVTSSEPDSGTGIGDVPGDEANWAIGTADTTGQLRAERADTGPGRIYTLTYEGSDVAGNTARCSATVTVPHDNAGLGSALKKH
jgi:hypothetical protein